VIVLKEEKTENKTWETMRRKKPSSRLWAEQGAGYGSPGGIPTVSGIGVPRQVL
jgi:hypothetical protein